jgi:hypothetical protein
MPYHLKRRGDEYFVVDDTGKRYSHSGLDKATARKQLIALNIAHARKEGYDIPKPDPPSDCGQEKCDRKAKLKGDLTHFYAKLKMIKRRNPVISRILTAPESLTGFDLIKQYENDQQQHIAETTSPSKELIVQSMETGDIEPRKKKMEMKSMETASVEPRKKVLETKSMEMGAVEPRKRVLETRSMETFAVEPAKKFSEMSNKERKNMYEKFHREGKLPDAVSAQYRKGYRTWFNKELKRIDSKP